MFHRDISALVGRIVFSKQQSAEKLEYSKEYDTWHRAMYKLMLSIIRREWPPIMEIKGLKSDDVIFKIGIHRYILKTWYAYMHGNEMPSIL